MVGLFSDGGARSAASLRAAGRHVVGLFFVGARSAASHRAAGRHVLGLFSVGARSAASHGAAGRHVIHLYGPGRDLVGLPATASGLGTVLGSF